MTFKQSIMSTHFLPEISMSWLCVYHFRRINFNQIDNYMLNGNRWIQSPLHTYFARCKFDYVLLIYFSPDFAKFLLSWLEKLFNPSVILDSIPFVQHKYCVFRTKATHFFIHQISQMRSYSTKLKKEIIRSCLFI